MFVTIYISALLLWCLVLLKGFHDKLERHGVAVESWGLILWSLFLAPLAVLVGLVVWVREKIVSSRRVL